MTSSTMILGSTEPWMRKMTSGNCVRKCVNPTRSPRKVDFFSTNAAGKEMLMRDDMRRRVRRAPELEASALLSAASARSAARMRDSKACARRAGCNLRAGSMPSLSRMPSRNFGILALHERPVRVSIPRTDDDDEGGAVVRVGRVEGCCDKTPGGSQTRKSWRREEAQLPPVRTPTSPKNSHSGKMCASKRYFFSARNAHAV